MSREIHVFGDWQELGETQPVGLLRVELAHGKETFSFEYSREWLEGDNAMSLDPAYDINPDPKGTELSLNISDSDNSLNLELALEVAKYFRVDDEKAKSIVGEVTNAVAKWRDIAGKMEISRGEQEAMATAFCVVE